MAGVIIDLANPFNLNEALRRQALRVLRIHSLRSAASLQLAAAIEWAGAPKEGELVAFDERLKAAARREGSRFSDDIGRTIVVAGSAPTRHTGAGPHG